MGTGPAHVAKIVGSPIAEILESMPADLCEDRS
jgi:hypothetical protein